MVDKKKKFIISFINPAEDINLKKGGIIRKRSKLISAKNKIGAKISFSMTKKKKERILKITPLK